MAGDFFSASPIDDVRLRNSALSFEPTPPRLCCNLSTATPSSSSAPSSSCAVESEVSSAMAPRGGRASHAFLASSSAASSDRSVASLCSSARYRWNLEPVSYTHLTLPTILLV